MEFAQPVLFCILAGLTGFSAIATVVTQNIVRSATWLLFALAGTSGIFFLLGADIVGAIQLLVYVGGTLILVVFGVMLTAQGPFINMKTGAAEWAISAVVGLILLAVLVTTISTVNLKTPAVVGDLKQEKTLLDKRVEADKAVAEAQKNLNKIGGALKGKLDLSAEEKAEYVKANSDAKKKVKELDKINADLAKLYTNASTMFAPKQPQSNDPAKSTYSATIGQGFLGVGVGPAHREGNGIGRTNYLLPFELVSVHLLVVLIGAAYLARAKRRRRKEVAV